MTKGISPGSSTYPYHDSGGETNLTFRQAARRAAMASMFTFIAANPGCVAYEISKATNISHSEVSRYIHWRRMEWRPLHTLMDIREHNRRFYLRLLQDAIYEVRDGKEGMMINTSKRAIFDRFCMAQGYYLTVSRRGQSFLYDFNDSNSNDLGIEKKFVLRMFDISSDDQKKIYEGRACQAKLM